MRQVSYWFNVFYHNERYLSVYQIYYNSWRDKPMLFYLQDDYIECSYLVYLMWWWSLIAVFLFFIRTSIMYLCYRKLKDKRRIMAFNTGFNYFTQMVSNNLAKFGYFDFTTAFCYYVLRVCTYWIHICSCYRDHLFTYNRLFTNLKLISNNTVICTHLLPSRYWYCFLILNFMHFRTSADLLPGAFFTRQPQGAV